MRALSLLSERHLWGENFFSQFLGIFRVWEKYPIVISYSVVRSPYGFTITSREINGNLNCFKMSFLTKSWSKTRKLEKSLARLCKRAVWVERVTSSYSLENERNGGATVYAVQSASNWSFDSGILVFRRIRGRAWNFFDFEKIRVLILILVLQKIFSSSDSDSDSDSDSCNAKGVR